MALLDILGFGGKILDKIIPDKGQRDKAKLELLKQQQEGAFKEDEMRYEAIVAEAKSADPWTSRARPSFLYLIYFMIGSSIPFAVLFIFDADAGRAAVEGMRLWLDAIPGALYATFTAGYLGYTTAREVGKANILKAKK